MVSDESIKNNVCNAFAFSIFETIHVGLFSNLVLQIKNNKKLKALKQIAFLSLSGLNDYEINPFWKFLAY